MGILAQTCKKRGVKSTGKKKWEMEKSQVGVFFYLIVEKYVVILLFSFLVLPDYRLVQRQLYEMNPENAK